MFEDDPINTIFIKALLATEPQAPLAFVLVEKNAIDQMELAGKHFDGRILTKMMDDKAPGFLDMQVANAPLEPSIIGRLTDDLALDYMRYSGYEKLADAGHTPYTLTAFDVTAMHSGDANLILIQVS